MNNSKSISSESLNIPHIGALDDLRGIAALMVLFAHITHNLTRGIDQSLGTWIHPSNFFIAVLAECHAGVSLFLVLSGFLFAYGAHDKGIDYKLFIGNRILRIYPMYLLMLFLGAYLNPAQFNFERFVASVFLFSNTGSALDGGGFTILLWTISVEFLFYLIFPFLHRFKTALGLKYLLHLTLLCIALRLLCISLGANPRDTSYFTILGRIDQFLIGMIGAHLYCIGYYRIRFPRLTLFATALLITISLFAFNRFGGWISEAKWKGVWHTYEGFLFCALIVTYLFSHTNLNRQCTLALSRIGLISYSMYLLHMPLLLTIQRNHLYVQLTGNLYMDAMISALYIIPIVMVLSSMTYFLIEKPFMSLRTRYLQG